MVGRINLPDRGRDQGVRDTGPFLGGLDYGTHPAVLVYDSPEVMDWLEGDRAAEIPDGTMIIKEMIPRWGATSPRRIDAPHLDTILPLSGWADQRSRTMSTPAYFRFTDTNGKARFVIALDDPGKIEHARRILCGEEARRIHVHGRIVKRPAAYQPGEEDHD